MRASLVLVLFVVCTIWALYALADEPHRRIDVGRVFDAGTAPEVIVITKTPADPDPLVERRQWVFDLRWDRGDISLLSARQFMLDAPQATPRVMGRFALELFEGPALVERVRFDFPMLAVPEAKAVGRDAPPLFTEKLRTRIGVIFPATARGTRLELVDRASARRWSLPWPPESGSSQPSDAAAPAPARRADRGTASTRSEDAGVQP